MMPVTTFRPRAATILGAILFAILFPALAALAHAGLEEGKRAYREGDYAVALREFLPLAEAGDVTVQNQVAAMYYAGQGTDPDQAKAAEWFRRAAERGSVDAQYLLGKLYVHGQGVPQNFDEAAKWLQEAALQGKPQAQALLASLYFSGQGVAKNEMKAFFWVELSSRAANLPEEDKKYAQALRDQIQALLEQPQVESVREMIAKWEPKRKRPPAGRFQAKDAPGDQAGTR
ncbi:tetratricopeptide repeat protein [Desulfolutivibrio sulfoxidireducens]|uniref:tetratricopeptide repeat protein n=1 Tax=Desulfolutivibrio sulfoxidireducens TaxID=2773299 RepID=UPI002108983A|nr:tetratricopeptide repeat protein [Desulfolutivibrio sulfoxidireducens]